MSVETKNLIEPGWKPICLTRPPANNQHLHIRRSKNFLNPDQELEHGPPFYKQIQIIRVLEQEGGGT